jgi:hypothetical protein
MSKSSEWETPKSIIAENKPDLGKSVIDKKYLKTPPEDPTPKKPRTKNPTDVGSRWVAPILLGLTILISLLLKLFNRN